DLLGAHLREILVTQDLLSAGAEDGDEHRGRGRRGRSLAARGRLREWRPGRAEAGPPEPALLAQCAQVQVSGALGRLAPEGLEGGFEEGYVLVPVHEQAPRRVPKVGAAAG